MKFLLLICIPPISLALYALWRTVFGPSLSKRTLNILYGILLLAYFFTTAGLGIFWVANQELPVFDLHYLFGYLTLSLVLIHLAFNWTPLSAFFRQRSPRIALVEGRGQWRPAVRVGASIIGFVLFGGTCFWLGHRYATTNIVVSEAAQARVVPKTVLATGPSVPGLVGTQKPPDISQLKIPAFLPKVGRQMVSKDGTKSYLSAYYHEETKHTRLSVTTKSGGLNWSTQPDVFKHYNEAEVVDLPNISRDVSMSAGETLEKRRQPVEFLSSAQLNFEQLSLLLHLTNGITGKLTYPGLTYYLRSAPSAGALYPTVTYLWVNHVEGLEPGLYHYKVNAVSLGNRATYVLLYSLVMVISR